MTTTVTDKFWCDGSYPEYWPPAKKSWCCHYRGKGCSTTTSIRIDCQEGEGNVIAGWSDYKKRYCCDSFGIACIEDRFDCEAGEALWESGWSQEKKDWCCDNKNVHCFPCKLPLYFTWSQEERGWCCHHENKCGPTTSPSPNCFEKVRDMIFR